MKTRQYHTIGARRNPADIVVIRSDNGRESLAITPMEIQMVNDAKGLIPMGAGKGAMPKDQFAKVRFYVGAVKKLVFRMERNDVKEWTTFACREEWRRESVDCVESARTLKVINSLTGDSVELLAEDNCIESEDVLLGVDENESWAKKLADCVDGELTLLPDEWVAFFEQCDGLVLEDSNGPRKPEGFEKQLCEAVEKLSEYLAEAHADEVNSNHGGDGKRGCSYCSAVLKAEQLLAKVKAEVAL